MRETDEVARAFNDGADARLRGLPYNAMPRIQAVLRKSWQDGYTDAHYWWGAAVHGRWQYQPLPEIQNDSR